MKKNIFNAQGHTKPIFEELKPYEFLVHWLLDQPRDSIDKLRDPEDLRSEYKKEMAELYKSEFKWMFKLVTKTTEWKRSINNFVHIPMPTTPGKPDSASAKRQTDDTPTPQKPRKSVDNDISNDDESDDSSEESSKAEQSVQDAGDSKKRGKSNKRPPDESFSLALQKVLPMIQIEQQFVTNFFKLSPAETDKFLQDMLIDGTSVEDSFMEMIREIYKIDPFLMLRLHTNSAKFLNDYKKESFISSLLKKIQDEITTLFGTKFLDSLTQNILGTQIRHIKRVGILEHVKKLINFVDKVESIREIPTTPFESPLYDKAYKDIFKTTYKFIFQITDQIKSKEKNLSSSLRRYSHILKFENFHHVYSQLETRKLAGLAPYIKEATENYETSVKAYVHEITSSLFSQLMTFFEGVDTRFRSMDIIEHETIQYEEQFSNRILSKLISKYPESTVKRGIYREYKRMHKALTQEENLLPNTWERTKTNVKEKFNHFEYLIARCYKNQRLQFDSARLTEMFAEVETQFEERYSKGGGGNQSDDSSLSDVDTNTSQVVTDKEGVSSGS